MIKIGVLALQGDFGLHAKMIEAAGATPLEVRDASDLAKVKGIVFPGGETTTLDKLLRSSGLSEAISKRYEKGTLPIYGTCMGMIILAKEIENFPELFRFGFIDATVSRNAYGRQVDSFEAAIKIHFGNGTSKAPFRAIFIRAPRISKLGASVKILAEHGGSPVLISQGNCLAGSFHPELTDDVRIHKFFIKHFVLGDG